MTVGDQREAIERELAARIPLENVYCEPVGRNTAASVGLAAVLVENSSATSQFLVIPADQLVGDGEAFAAAARAAEVYVASHDVFLRSASRRRGRKRVTDISGPAVRRPGAAERRLRCRFSFHEKPPIETARAYLAAGNYLWNSGMFMWRPSVIRGAIAKHLPALAEVLRKISGRLGTEPADDVLKDVYPGAPATSMATG